MTQLIQRVTASAFVLGFVAAVLVAAAHPSAMVQGKVTDAALKDRIEHRLQTDPDVRKYDIRVKVDSGDVKLEGTVATSDQKTEAETLAKMGMPCFGCTPERLPELLAGALRGSDLKTLATRIGTAGRSGGA